MCTTTHKKSFNNERKTIGANFIVYIKKQLKQKDGLAV